MCIFCYIFGWQKRHTNQQIKWKRVFNNLACRSNRIASIFINRIICASCILTLLRFTFYCRMCHQICIMISWIIIINWSQFINGRKDCIFLKRFHAPNFIFENVYVSCLRYNFALFGYKSSLLLNVISKIKSRAKVAIRWVCHNLQLNSFAEFPIYKLWFQMLWRSEEIKKKQNSHTNTSTAIFLRWNNTLWNSASYVCARARSLAYSFSISHRDSFRLNMRDVVGIIIFFYSERCPTNNRPIKMFQELVKKANNVCLWATSNENKNI